MSESYYSSKNEWEKDVRLYIADEFKKCLMTLFEETANEWAETIIDPELRESCSENSRYLDDMYPMIAEFAGDEKDTKGLFKFNMESWVDKVNPLMKELFDNKALSWKIKVQDITEDLIPLYLIMLKSVLTCLEHQEKRNAEDRGHHE